MEVLIMCLANATLSVCSKLYLVLIRLCWYQSQQMKCWKILGNDCINICSSTQLLYCLLWMQYYLNNQRRLIEPEKTCQGKWNFYLLPFLNRKKDIKKYWFPFFQIYDKSYKWTKIDYLIINYMHGQLIKGIFLWNWPLGALIWLHVL